MKPGDGGGGGGNFAEEGIVARLEDDGQSLAVGEVAAGARDIFGLVQQLVQRVGPQLDVHVLARQRGVVDLEVL